MMQVNDRASEERALAAQEARGELAAELRAERDALRAIIDGRTVPPTAAEIEAHHAAGGAWFVRAPWRPGVWVTEVAWREVRDVWSEGAVCIALDAQRKPCAWPVVMEVGQ